jgi:hypothetical protein
MPPATASSQQRRTTLLEAADVCPYDTRQHSRGSAAHSTAPPPRAGCPLSGGGTPAMPSGRLVTIADELLSPSRRDCALCELEALANDDARLDGVHIAPALTELLRAPGVTRGTFRRAGLLRGRLALAADDPTSVFVAAHTTQAGVVSLLSVYDATENAVGRALRMAPSQLSKEDAIDYACMVAMDAPSARFGWSRILKAIGQMDGFASYTLCRGQAGMALGVRRRMVELMLELVAELPQRPAEAGRRCTVGEALQLDGGPGGEQQRQVLVAGAWTAAHHLSLSKDGSIQRHLVDSCGIFATAMCDLSTYLMKASPQPPICRPSPHSC